MTLERGMILDLLRLVNKLSQWFRESTYQGQNLPIHPLFAQVEHQAALPTNCLLHLRLDLHVLCFVLRRPTHSAREDYWAPTPKDQVGHFHCD